MYKYYKNILLKSKYIPILLNKIKQMVNKKQFGKYYWFARQLRIDYLVTPSHPRITLQLLFSSRLLLTRPTI